MPKYLSGRVKRSPQSALSTDRYQYLGLDQAEPNIGDPPSPLPTVPTGQQFQLISIREKPGERYWVPISGGIIPGSLTVRDEGTVVPPGGISSITDMNFKGDAITVTGYTDSNGHPGTAVTVTVAPTGLNHQVLFNDDGEFGAGSYFVYDNSTVGIASVGIGTSTPTQNLHIVGNLRLTGTIYDTDNEPGGNNNILKKNATGGIEWVRQEEVLSGAGGTISQMQYHDDTGLVGGAKNFVWIESSERVGIGSTQPERLLEVLGATRLSQLEVTGVTTTGGLLDINAGGQANTFKVEDLTETRVVYAGAGGELKDSANLTFDGQVLRASNGFWAEAGISTLGNVTITGNTINTKVGGLTLDSSSGSITAQDAVIIADSTGSIDKDTGSLITNGGVGIEENLNVGGRLNIIGISTFNGIGTFTSHLYVGDLFSVIGVTTLAGAGGSTTTGGDLYVRGFIRGDKGIEYDEGIFERLIVSGVSTFKDDVEFHGNTGVTTLRWDKSQNSLEFNDETKTTFGTNRDLQISHTMSLKGQEDSEGNDILASNDWASLIEEKGTGPLIFKSDGGPGPGAFQFYDTAWRALVRMHSGSNARVVLYAGGLERLVTTTNGVDITGGLNVTGISTLAASGGITTTGGDLYVAGDLYVKDDVVFDDINAVNAKFTGQLGVTGVSTFTGIGTFGSDLYIHSDLYVGGAVFREDIVARNLSVSGVTSTLYLNVIGVSTFGGISTFNSNVFVEGTIDTDQLNVTGVATFLGPFHDKDGTVGSQFDLLQSTGSGVEWVTPDDITAGTAEKSKKVEITDDTTGSGTHYIHFGSETSGYDGVEVDSGGLIYKDDNFGVGVEPESGAKIQIASNNTANPFLATRYNSGSDGAVLFLQHSRSNTIGTKVRLNDGDEIGAIEFRSYKNDNTTIGQAAQIMAEADGAADLTDVPAALVFKTNNESGAGTAQERLRITKAGDVGIGTDNPVDTNINSSLTTNTKVLAVGVVTANTVYGNEYYGLFKGTISNEVAIEKADTVKITNDTTDSGNHYVHFGSETSGYDGVEIDNTGLRYNSGTLIPSSLNVTGVSTFNSRVNLIGVNAGVTSAYWDATDNRLHFENNAKATFGTSASNRLSISHTKDEGIINLNNLGTLRIQHGVGIGNSTKLEVVGTGVSINQGLLDKDGSVGTSLQLLQSTGSQVVWANPDAVTIGEAKKIRTQEDNTTNSSLYLTFVPDNNTSGTHYEEVFTDEGIKYNPAQNELIITGGVSIGGTLTYDDVTNIDSIGLVTARSGIQIKSNGLDVVGISTFSSHLLPLTNEGGNIGESASLRWNEVYAKEFFGTFKGTIDPGTPTLSIASSLTDLLGVYDDENVLFPKDAGADKIMFWDESATKATYLSIGDGLEIDGTDLNATSSAGKTYSLPLTGATGGNGVGQATWTLTDDVTPTAGTDPVTLKAGANVSIDASSVGSGEFTIAAVQGAGLALNSNITNVFNLPNPGELGAVTPSGTEDLIIFYDRTIGGLQHLNIGTGLEIDGTDLNATSAAGKTYELDGVNEAPDFTLRLKDNSDPVVNDDITFRAGTNVSFADTTADGVTINAIAGAGMDTDASTADVLTITGAILSADDPGADRIVFWDETASKLTHLSVGSGLEIDGTVLKADSSAGKTYELPVTGSDGTGGASGGSGSATLTLTDNVTPTPGTDPVTITAGSGIVIDSITGSGFRLSADSGTILGNVEVKQYSDNLPTRTVRSCKDPIGVVVASGTATIGIGTTSNAYGKRYVQTTDPTTADGGSHTVCEGDIWYDTSTTGDGGVTVTNKTDATYYNMVFITNSSSTSLLVNDNDRLQVRPSDGAVRVAGDITAFYSSDERLKDNIVPIPNALDKIVSISGNTFEWNENSDHQGEEVGVIAQEVEELGLPGITITRNDGTKAVRYEKLIPLLIEAIKELKVEVDELKGNK